MTAKLFSLPCYRRSIRKDGLSHKEALRLARQVAEEMFRDGDLVADPNTPARASEPFLRAVPR